MTKRQQAVSYFIAQGWTPQQSAGIVANLEAESALRPDAVGDGGLAYGIAQWHPPRQAHFAAEFGKDIKGSSLEEQLEFVHRELTTTESAAGDALSSCVTAAEAGAVVSTMYERPRDREGEARKRAQRAEAIHQGHSETALEQSVRPATPPDAPTPPTPPKEAPMGPLALLQLFGPILGALIPQIAPILTPGGQKYAGVAQTVLDTITKAAGTPGDLGSAVQKMQTDPAVKATVQAAVLTEPSLIETFSIGPGGVDGAGKRMMQLVAPQPEDRWYSLIVRTVFNPVLIVTMGLLPLVYIIVLGLVPLFVKMSSDAVTGIVNMVISLALGGIAGFWLGQVYQQSQSRKVAEASTTTTTSAT